METQTFLLDNNEALKISEAKLEDASDMIAFGKIVGNETDMLTFDGDEFDFTLEKEQSIIQSHLDAPNKLFILARINGDLVGMLNFSAKNRRKIRHVGEFGISVLKKHWNKKIGRHMITTMIHWAKATKICLLYTSPSPRDRTRSRMPSSA